jgi:hypothetical protein
MKNAVLLEQDALIADNGVRRTPAAASWKTLLGCIGT